MSDLDIVMSKSSDNSERGSIGWIAHYQVPIIERRLYIIPLCSVAWLDSSAVCWGALRGHDVVK